MVQNGLCIFYVPSAYHTPLKWLLLESSERKLHTIRPVFLHTWIWLDTMSIWLLVSRTNFFVNIVINFPCYFTLLHVNSSHENDVTRLNKKLFWDLFLLISIWSQQTFQMMPIILWWVNLFPICVLFRVLYSWWLLNLLKIWNWTCACSWLKKFLWYFVLVLHYCYWYHHVFGYGFRLWGGDGIKLKFLSHEEAKTRKIHISVLHSVEGSLWSTKLLQYWRVFVEVLLMFIICKVA